MIDVLPHNDRFITRMRFARWITLPLRGAHYASLATVALCIPGLLSGSQGSGLLGLALLAAIVPAPLTRRALRRRVERLAQDPDLLKDPRAVGALLDLLEFYDTPLLYLLNLVVSLFTLGIGNLQPEAVRTNRAQIIKALAQALVAVGPDEAALLRPGQWRRLRRLLRYVNDTSLWHDADARCVGEEILRLIAECSPDSLLEPVQDCGDRALQGFERMFLWLCEAPGDNATVTGSALTVLVIDLFDDPERYLPVLERLVQQKRAACAELVEALEQAIAGLASERSDYDAEHQQHLDLLAPRLLQIRTGLA